MESRLHQAARWYARHGYAIFPLRANRKEPAVKEWQHVATTDIEQVDRWWRNNPAYNIGINCGASDIVVLDFDTYKSGIRTDALFDDDELLGAVLTRTPHGRTHAWFRQPYAPRLTNAVGDLPKHIAVRGHGGYIITLPGDLD